MDAEAARPKDLGTLDGSRGGLILPRRVKATPGCRSPTQIPSKVSDRESEAVRQHEGTPSSDPGLGLGRRAESRQFRTAGLVGFPAGPAQLAGRVVRHAGRFLAGLLDFTGRSGAGMRQSAAVVARSWRTEIGLCAGDVRCSIESTAPPLGASHHHAHWAAIAAPYLPLRALAA